MKYILYIYTIFIKCIYRYIKYIYHNVLGGVQETLATPRAHMRILGSEHIHEDPCVYDG